MKIQNFMLNLLNSVLLVLFGILMFTTVKAADQLVSVENANWEVFTSQSNVRTLLPSDDGKTLWVGTGGGLEQRDANTGELVRLFTNLNGLPSNAINVLESDGNGGLWIGTDGGLAHRTIDGEWTVYHQDNSGLPSNYINAIESDDNSGLWIVTSLGALTYRSVSGEWTVYMTGNSGLPSNNIETLESDSSGGLWIGTRPHFNEKKEVVGGGLAYRSVSGEWTIYNQDNSGLLSNWISALKSDGNGGLWIGTIPHKKGEVGGGLSYRSVNGEWAAYNQNNSGLPNSNISVLESDGSGGLWIGTHSNYNYFGDKSEGSGLAYHSINGEWTVYNQDNSVLPSNNINILKSDGSGGLWIGTKTWNNYSTSSNMVYRSVSGGWTVYTRDNSKLPDHITALLRDSNDGLWIGTEMGLAHSSISGEWTVDYQDSGLPSSYVPAIESDGSGGLWIANWDSLAYRSPNSEWTVYTIDNLGLPVNTTINTLESDGNGGLWIGTTTHTGTLKLKNNLVYRSVNGELTVYYQDSGLSNNLIKAMESDSNGGLWIGTWPDFNEKGEIGGGLSYRSASGEWMVYNQDNSGLPSNWIHALESDGNGGLWIGTHDAGLVSRSINGEWTVYYQDSGLPNNSISAIESDGSGGLWVGTGAGLAYRSISGEWTVFTTDNSVLPNTHLLLESDGSGGLWIGTSGLIHLTFSQKSTLAQTIKDETVRTELLMGKRAAILIHPNGDGSGYNQGLAVDFMATYAYHTLQARGYDNDEIYFLSYKPDLDFNDDAQADYNIVDAPVTLAELRNDDTAKPRDITVNDIKQAFEWAKTKGKLNQPLVVIFVDHGLPNELILNPLGTETLTANTFKALLDEYQNSTNNQVIVIIEACYSGTFVPTLKAPNRLIISSTTNEEQAYFSDYGRTSFLKLYFDNLRRNESFGKSLELVTDVLTTYSWPLNQQRPQISENTIAQNLHLNGDWGKLVGEPILKPETFLDITNPGQQIDLTVYINTSDASVKQVWASVIPPEIANQRNEQGYSLQPPPFIPLSFQSMNTRKNDEKWQGSFSKFTTPGDYVFTFKAKDHKGFITDTPPITLTVTGEGLTYARFDATTNIVHIPAVTVGTDIYQADLLVRQFEPEIILDVDTNSLRLADDTTSVGYSNFTPGTGEVYIPLLEVPNATAGIDTYSVNLTLVPQTSPMQFRVEDLKRLP